MAKLLTSLFKGTEHFECTTIGHDQPWCSTEVSSNGSYVGGKWGNCENKCLSVLDISELEQELKNFKSKVR